MDEEYTTAEEDFTPSLRVQAPTQVLGTSTRDAGHHADDTCSTLRSNYSSDSSYQHSVCTTTESGLMGITRVLEGDNGYVNAYNMLTGIRTAVSIVCAKAKPQAVGSHHFSDSPEFTFDAAPIVGTHGTQGTKAPFKFKDYSPHIFREIRESVFQLDAADYLMSLTGKYIVSELTSPGKSGSFFYYSRDYRFIIKTIHHSEHRRMRCLLRDYYRHVRQYPDTLVSRYFGLHRVTLPFGRRIYFVVMNNVFPALYEIHARYDLKGSTYGRTAGNVDASSAKNVCFKDLDWRAQHRKIRLGPKKRARFLEQLRRDVEMLQKCGVMDYSLLIGEHDLTRGNERGGSLLNLHDLHSSGSSYLSPNRRDAMEEFDVADSTRSPFEFYQDNGGYQSTDCNDLPNPTIYFMGVIDFLTYYNTRKRLETTGKGVLHHRDKKGLSAIPAHAYGERFYDFIASQIEAGPSDGAS